MDKFTCIKKLYDYVENINERIDKELHADMKLLADYVLDNIFEHEIENMNTKAFDELSLRKVCRYNQKYKNWKHDSNEKYDDMFEYVFGHHLDLLNFIASDKKCASLLGVKFPERDEWWAVEPINKLPIEHYYEYTASCPEDKEVRKRLMHDFENFLYDTEFIPMDDYRRVNFVYTDGSPYRPTSMKLLPLSIPRIHESNEFYILHFIKDGPNFNRLRKLILALVKEQVYQ